VNVKLFGGSGGGKGKEDKIWISCETGNNCLLCKKGYTFREVVDNALRALMELIKICTTYSRVW
jgi:hypothetical protein